MTLSFCYMSGILKSENEVISQELTISSYDVWTKNNDARKESSSSGLVGQFKYTCRMPIPPSFGFRMLTKVIENIPAFSFEWTFKCIPRCIVCRFLFYFIVVCVKTRGGYIYSLKKPMASM